MKRIPAYLAAAAVALFWAADGRAANDPDEGIAAERPYMRVPVSGHRPNSFVKLSANLPLNEFDLSGNRSKSFLRISEEMPHADYRKISGSLPNSFVKISVHLSERMDTEDVAQYGLNRQIKISDHLPYSLLKISSQYPTPKEN